jgi:hypothetical protein
LRRRIGGYGCGCRRAGFRGAQYQGIGGSYIGVWRRGLAERGDWLGPGNRRFLGRRANYQGRGWRRFRGISGRGRDRRNGWGTRTGVACTISVCVWLACLRARIAPRPNRPTQIRPIMAIASRIKSRLFDCPSSTSALMV